MEDGLRKFLSECDLSGNLIEDVIDSGYFLHQFHDFSGNLYDRICDKFYGTKGFSSCFDPINFVQYLKNEEHNFRRIENRRIKVKTIEEIRDILNDESTKRFIDAGRICFRGQHKDYFEKRKIPNPVRSDIQGNELTILPGIFRNKTLGFNKYSEFFSKSSIINFLHELETESIRFDYSNIYNDLMRVEQHYATQTAGLDISFEINTAIYFATHRYSFENDKATNLKIKGGEHQGSIYLFRFLDPPVKKTEFYIREFDFFKTYTPERILRQHCGLPLFSEYERNIAVCDLHYIIDLHEDFKFSDGFDYTYMFPSRNEDAFYDKLLMLKARHPVALKNIVEYS